MAQAIVQDILTEMRERGLFPGARCGSTIEPRLFGTICAVRADSPLVWVTWDGRSPEMVTEHAICPLGYVEAADDLEEVA